MTTTEFIQFLLERFQIEWKRRDRSGIYGLTQRLLLITPIKSKAAL